jgi:hypothetical protein
MNSLPSTTPTIAPMHIQAIMRKVAEGGRLTKSEEKALGRWIVETKKERKAANEN